MHREPLHMKHTHSVHVPTAAGHELASSARGSEDGHEQLAQAAGMVMVA
jgi:hypothetical protein